MKKGDMLFALYVYIVGIATAKGKGEPVSARVKLLSTGDVEVTTKARMISVAEVKKFLAGFLAKAQAGEAGAIGNYRGVPMHEVDKKLIPWTPAEYKALTALTVCTWYVGFSKVGWYNTVLAKHLSRSFSAHTKQTDTKPSTKKQRVATTKSTPAPKVGKVTPAVARAEQKRRAAKRKDGKHRVAKNTDAQRMSGKELSTIAAK